MQSTLESVKNTSKEEILRIFKLQSQHQYTYANETSSSRYERLSKLQKAVESNRDSIRKAVYSDFKKPATEVDATEILPIIAELKFAKRNLNKWLQSKSVPTPLTMLGATSKIKYEPKGVGLIISPWNFPIMLTLAPLIGAIAAGCPVILKPSENTPHSSAILAEIISETFDEKEVALVQGAVQTSADLLELPFNHIYFTGAPSIGKIVMAAAAKNLSSVTLELGGKSPVIVDETANLKIAAKRIAWAKFMNSGQICIAPDYVIVQSSVKEKLIKLIKANLVDFFSESSIESDSYARMVNGKHFTRVNAYLKDAIEKNGKIEHGGKVDASENFIEPTLVSGLSDDASLLQEEIFGPVLPLVEFTDIKKVPEIIQQKEKPLALYIYSKSRRNIKFILNNTRAGGTAVNHSLVHIFNPNLPFGGSNNSGIGKGMGYYGFLEFVNPRGVLHQKLTFSATDLLMPPYTGFKSWIVKVTEKWLS